MQSGGKVCDADDTSSEGPSAMVGYWSDNVGTLSMAYVSAFSQAGWQSEACAGAPSTDPKHTRSCFRKGTQRVSMTLHQGELPSFGSKLQRPWIAAHFFLYPVDGAP